MEVIGTKALRPKLGAVVKKVAGGEPVLITIAGKPKAWLLPVPVLEEAKDA